MVHLVLAAMWGGRRPKRKIAEQMKGISFSERDDNTIVRLRVHAGNITVAIHHPSVWGWMRIQYLKQCEKIYE